MNIRHQYEKHLGFTLIELLIAMLVGIFVIGGTLAFFMQSSNTQKAQHQVSMLRENADFALATLIEDIQLAGYFGCATRWNDAKSVNTLNDKTGFEWNFAQVIEGNDYTYDAENDSSSWTPALDDSLNNVLRGDVVTIRRADRQEYSIVSHASSTSPLYIESGNRIKQKDFLLVTDCENSSIFQKTNSNYTQSIAHTLTAVSPGNETEELGRTYTNEAKLMPLSTVSYYVRNNTDGIPALYRRYGGGITEEVISGIEDLQFSYGVDQDGNFSVDQHMTAQEVDAGDLWDSVLTVRVELLARTLDDGVTVAESGQDYFFGGENQTKSDGYLRMVVSADITLRNRMI